MLLIFTSFILDWEDFGIILEDQCCLCYVNICHLYLFIFAFPSETTRPSDNKIVRNLLQNLPIFVENSMWEAKLMAFILTKNWKLKQGKFNGFSRNDN